jgi:hypothetical protein
VRGFLSFATHGTFGAKRVLRVCCYDDRRELSRKGRRTFGRCRNRYGSKNQCELRRLSDAWATLAGQIEKDPRTVRQRNAALKQSHQTEPRKANTDTAQVADILRERLQLSDSDEPKS